MSQLTIAISEHLVQEAFKGFVDNFSFHKTGGDTSGTFQVSWEVAMHLHGGKVEMRDDNSLLIKELDIKWDTLKLTLGLNIPEFCVGGWCIVPNPFDGCWVRLPKFCLFSDNPDISLPLDLSHAITSEVSGAAGLMTRHVVNPDRDPGWSDWEAEEQGKANKWQIFIDPHYLDIDILDIADMAGDLADALNKAISDFLKSLGLPDWAVDAAMAFLGPIPALLRTLLDIGDDFGEWVKDLIGDHLGILKQITLALADYFKVNLSIYEVNDPYRIMQAVDAQPGVDPLVAVKLPITQLAVHINSQEMVMEGSVGE